MAKGKAGLTPGPPELPSATAAGSRKASGQVLESSEQTQIHTRHLVQPNTLCHRPPYTHSPSSQARDKPAEE